MKSQREILERINEETRRLGVTAGHLASITRGWLDALEWVLENDHE